MTHEVIFENPEEDESVARMLKEGLHEIHIMGHRGTPILSIPEEKLNPKEKVLRELSEVNDFYDLIDPEKRQELFDALEESERIYRRGLNDAGNLRIG